MLLSSSVCWAFSSLYDRFTVAQRGGEPLPSIGSIVYCCGMVSVWVGCAEGREDLQLPGLLSAVAL